MQATRPRTSRLTRTLPPPHALPRYSDFVRVSKAIMMNGRSIAGQVRAHAPSHAHPHPPTPTHTHAHAITAPAGAPRPARAQLRHPVWQRPVPHAARQDRGVHQVVPRAQRAHGVAGGSQSATFTLLGLPKQSLSTVTPSRERTAATSRLPGCLVGARWEPSTSYCFIHSRCRHCRRRH
jgi:hypothetical protein